MVNYNLLLNENNFEYCTPKYIVDMFGPFDYDPASTKEQAKVLGIENYSTIETDGLKQDWTQFEKIWVNPPSYQTYEFLKKAVKTYQKAGNKIYFLASISILTTKEFHKITGNVGTKLYIPNSRIKFMKLYTETEETPTFSCVIFRIQATNELAFFDIE